MTSDKHALNRSSYDSVASAWDAARTSIADRERRYVDMLLNGCPAGETILDLGCGTGRPMGEYVIGRGFHVMGIDQSSGLLEIARARFPSETWIESPIENWPGDGSFCGAICWDAVFHVERVHHAPVLSRIFSCLTAGARLILTSGGSANDPFTDLMFEREFFYDSLPPERLLSLMTDIGYELRLVEYLDLPTGGRDKGRLGVVAEKPDIVL